MMWQVEGKNRGNTIKHLKSDIDNSELHNFACKLDDNYQNDETAKMNSLQVNCRAATHCLNDISKFTHLDKELKPERHFIELAYGTRSDNIAK